MPYWPRYFDKDETDASVEYQTLYMSGSKQYVENNLNKAKCDFWDGLDYYNENRAIEDGMKYLIQNVN